MRVGIEVGGTFTDLVAVDGERVVIAKVPSTPKAPNIGALNALEAAGIAPSDVTDLVHGSTVATNAVLERKGHKTAFVTTKGFRDVLFLQRHSRNKTYDLFYQHPRPVVDRASCFEVSERMGTDGGVIQALDEEAVVRELVPQLKAGDFQAVAICLIGAYANPAHEQKLEEILRAELPDLLLTPSYVVTQEFREFERASTTTLSAYVQPVVYSYLTRFAEQLAERGFAGRLSLMQSNGGRLPVEAMRRNAVTSILSGPAAGLTGAIRQLERSGQRELLTFDMGGTSTDVSMVTGARAILASGMQIDDMPIRTPVLDIVTVGAGGGSIAWLDDGGMLRVGPRSAGADPGPACYGKGGTLPTVTDALVLLGLIEAGSLLGDTIRIDGEASERAFLPLAERYGKTPREMAQDAISLATANIVRAIQVVSTERGHDPRDFSLVPFGGAGPLLASAVAVELGISTIAIPPNPGVLSAYGLLAADDMKISTLTRRMRIDEDAPKAIRAVYGEMREKLLGEIEQLGMKGPFETTFTIEMRFVGQAFEIPVNVDVAEFDKLDAKSLHASFDQAHRQVFLHGADDRPTEAVSFRLAIASPAGNVPAVSEVPHDRIQAGSTQIHFEGVAMPCAIARAPDLKVGEPVQGPALIKGYSSTLFVPPAWAANLDENYNIILRKAD
jgi:N-methylhydantoinase A